MSPQRTPVRPDLLSADLHDLSAVTLMGSRCRQCAETALGVSTLCQNCGSADLSPIALSRDGVLWTYTVVRHRPPGDYRGGEPPFGLGLVELPEGIRVLAPLGGAVDALHIGQALVFRPTLLKGDAGDEIVAFEFVPPNTNTGVVS